MPATDSPDELLKGVVNAAATQVLITPDVEGNSMKALKKITLACLVGLGALLSIPAFAQTPSQEKPPAAGATADMTEGEIKKVDKDTKRLTIKHGDIKNLDMPGMTMVFQVRDEALVSQVKAGDKVRFKVEKGAAGFVVTELQPTTAK